MYVALRGMYSDGNFAFRRKMKKNFNPKFCLFEPVKRNAKEKKREEKKIEKKREEKRREIIAGRFSAPDEGEWKADS